MRILHIDSGRHMRGGQHQVLFLLEGLRQAGHDCILLSAGGSPLLERALAAGVDARPLSLYSVRRFSRLADLTHVHDGRSHAFAALLAVPRLIVSRRVAFPVKDSFFARWQYRCAARYVAVSSFVRRVLVEAGVPEGRVSVVHDGVPLLEPSRPSSRILAPASGDPMKGSDLVRRAAARAGVQVHFSAGLPGDLRDAGLFVYITRQEGLGSGVLLAMSAGVPVIASRTGGLPEIVEHEQTGLLTENAPDAIAACIRRLLDDPPLAARLAARARERVRRDFSIANMVARTVAIYQEVLSC